MTYYRPHRRPLPRARAENTADAIMLMIALACGAATVVAILMGWLP